MKSRLMAVSIVKRIENDTVLSDTRAAPQSSATATATRLPRTQPTIAAKTELIHDRRTPSNRSAKNAVAAATGNSTRRWNATVISPPRRSD